MLSELLKTFIRDELIIVFVKKMEQVDFLVRILFDLLNKLGTGLPTVDEYLKTSLSNSYFHLCYL